MYQIKKATSEHLDEIVSLWLKLMNLHKGFDEDFFADIKDYIANYRIDMRSHLEDSYKIIFVATYNNNTIGYVTAEICPFHYLYYNTETYCTVGDITLEEEYQHLGIGKLFLEEVKKWAKSYEVNKLILNVFSKNTKALNFFKKQGFDDNFNTLVLEF